MDSQALGPRLFHKGAEADLFLSKLGRWNVVIKRRVRKRYRNPDLDEKIRRNRTAREALALHQSRKAGVRTPSVLSLDLENYSISMIHLKGTLARDSLDMMNMRTSFMLFKEVGHQIALLHMDGIVHGDLTTSNIIITEKNAPFIIDFGLSTRSDEIEDRGVDIHLLRRSIATSHAIDPEHCSRAVSRGYRRSAGHAEAVRTLRKAAEIARRGRYFALR